MRLKAKQRSMYVECCLNTYDDLKLSTRRVGWLAVWLIPSFSPMEFIPLCMLLLFFVYLFFLLFFLYSIVKMNRAFKIGWTLSSVEAFRIYISASSDCGINA